MDSLATVKYTGVYSVIFNIPRTASKSFFLEVCVELSVAALTSSRMLTSAGILKVSVSLGLTYISSSSDENTSRRLIVSIFCVGFRTSIDT